MPYLVPIVEGHGDVDAAPALVHRIARTISLPTTLVVETPIRVNAKQFLNNAECFRKHVGTAALTAARRKGSVLILLDCDEKNTLPCQLGPDILLKAKTVRDDVNIIVALAFREFESWFLAAARSLSGHHGLPDNLEPPANLFIRGASEWLSGQMDQPYRKRTHQLAFTRKFNLDEARANPSFDRFHRRIHEFLTQDQ